MLPSKKRKKTSKQVSMSFQSVVLSPQKIFSFFMKNNTRLTLCHLESGMVPNTKTSWMRYQNKKQKKQNMSRFHHMKHSSLAFVLVVLWNSYLKNLNQHKKIFETNKIIIIIITF